MQTTRQFILTIILLVIIMLPIAAWPRPFIVKKHEFTGDGQTKQIAEVDHLLEPSKPIERELSGGQSHFYKINMTTGQYVKLVVRQRGIDVLLALFRPDGSNIGEEDEEHVIDKSETFSAIAEAAGAYRVEVRSRENNSAKGRYEIRIEILREASAEDKYRVAADSEFREAQKLSDGSAKDKEKSIEKYQFALNLYRKAGERGREADTLNNIAATYFSLGEMHKALQMLNDALPVRKLAGDSRGMGDLLNNIASVLSALGEKQQALEKYNEALPIFREHGDRREEADTLSNIGLVYDALGDKRQALEHYNDALRVSREVGDRRGQGVTLNNIGMIYDSLGDKQKALEKYNEALSIRREVGDRGGEGITLLNIGAVYRTLGESQKALEKYNEALPIFQNVGYRVGEATMLDRIGTVYRELGEAQKALENFKKALAIRRAVGDRRGEAITVNNIGMVYDTLGEKPKALEQYNEALPISREVGDRSGEAGTLHNIGALYDGLEESSKALEYYNKALPLRRAIGDRDGEAATLLGIARVNQKRGNPTDARQSIEEAIGIVESLRTKTNIQELRVSYIASRRQYYDFYLDVLMGQHRQNPTSDFDAIAFAVSERARARSLLELLRESRAEIRQGVPGSLLERERSIQQLLNTKAAAQVALLNRKHTPAQADALAQEIAAITLEFEELRAKIRSSNPKYADLTQPQPLNLKEIRQQVLDPDTLLLEYFLGENASYLFLVSQNSLTSHQLPKRAEIEAATRRVLDLLTAPQPQPGDTAAKYQARIKEAKANYTSQAAALSRILLGPVASKLGKKRLLIVADGALQYLPFSALTIPESGNAATSHPLVAPTPLIVEHEIVHLPSASALVVLRRELAGRQPAAKTVAVLADPVFSADDGRVKSGNKTPAGKEAPEDLTRSINDVRGELKRLLLTRDEAQAILSVSPRTAALGALDFRANRATATSDELSNYRIVHFATHGLLNSEHPELSGLVLSLVNEQGRAQDGFLRLHDIFNLRLPAELVVLSACQTGLGKKYEAEGLVGLTRGFMYAGAARVVASLWQVNDAATAELMKRFYRRMLVDGMRPAAALREAQIEMWKRPQWQSPFYWGAFVIQGEWK